MIDKDPVDESRPGFPPINEELVEHLERMFPERFPDLTGPMPELLVYQGKIELIRLLRATFEDQASTAAKPDDPTQLMRWND